MRRRPRRHFYSSLLPFGPLLDGHAFVLPCGVPAVGHGRGVLSVLPSSLSSCTCREIPRNQRNTPSPSGAETLSLTPSSDVHASFNPPFLSSTIPLHLKLVCAGFSTLFALLRHHHLPPSQADTHSLHCLSPLHYFRALYIISKQHFLSKSGITADRGGKILLEDLPTSFQMYINDQ